MSDTALPQLEPPITILTECLKCGYSLEGHGAQGRCPECGFAYDKYTGAWRKGKLLIVINKLTLPLRCVKCDSTDAVWFKKRSLYWHHPALYLLILLNFLLYLLVGLIVRKRGLVYAGLCKRHRRRRNWFMFVTWLVGLGSIGLLIQAGRMESGWLAVGAIGLFLGTLLFWVLAGQIVTPVRIDKTFLWLKGADAAYLANFPVWPYDA